MVPIVNKMSAAIADIILAVSEQSGNNNIAKQLCLDLCSGP